MAEDISARVAWALKKALTPKDAAAPSGRGTATFVRRDESGVGWVRIPGNDFDTPVAGGIVAEAQPGDTVTYNIENNGVTITGNSTSPSVGGRFVGEALAPVRKAVSGLGGRVAASLNIAEAAQAVASAVNQHFWPDSNGIHVTEATQEDFAQQPQDKNILINSLGMLLRDAETWLAQFTSGVVAFYDGLGNAASNIFARFGTDGAQIGYASQSHIEMDYRSLSLVDREGTPYFDVRDLRDADGYVHFEMTGLTGDGTTTEFHLDDARGDYMPMVPSDIVSVAVDGTEVDYVLPHPEDSPIDTVQIVPAPANGAEIVVNIRRQLDQTFKQYTLGIRHGDAGTRSYALGTGVYAGRDNVYALGRYNREVRGANDASSDYYYGGHALILGNGTSDTNRSNAAVIDWDGRAEFYGDFVRIAHKVADREAMFTAERPDKKRVIRFGIDSNGSDRGIWDAGTASYDADPIQYPDLFPGYVQTYASGDWVLRIDSLENVHIRDHSADLQTNQTSSSVSVANNADRSITSLAIYGSGCYILIGHVVFVSNSSGRRVIGITTAQNGSLGTGASSPIITQRAVDGASTAMTVVDVVNLPWPSASDPNPHLVRYLTVYQNSGGALSCTGSIKAIKVMAPE